MIDSKKEISVRCLYGSSYEVIDEKGARLTVLPEDTVTVHMPLYVADINVGGLNVTIRFLAPPVTSTKPARRKRRRA